MARAHEIRGISVLRRPKWNVDHSDFSTTENIYSHLTSDTKVRTAESMMKTLGMTEKAEGKTDETIRNMPEAVQKESA